MTELFNEKGEATQAYWNRYAAIVNAIKAAGLKHPHSADIHAYTRMSRSVEDCVKDWGSSRLNR